MLSAAALAAERMARLRRWPSRWIWALAIVMSLFIPTVIATVSVQLPIIVNGVSPPASQKLIALREVTAVNLSPSAWVGATPANTATWRIYDHPLQLAWLAASGAMVFLLLLSGAQLYWRKRRWTNIIMAGTSVYTAANVGPAVVGLLRPRIVVPDWLTQSPASVQSAVIAHEQAHLETNDPQLFMLALGLLIFMPWNLPLWWHLRRLRRAIEVDCDARVLRKGIDAVNYGETLFAVGQRQSTYIGAVAAMSESTSFLEERLRIMLKQPAKWWRPAAAALGCLSVLLVALAAQVSPPNAANAANRKEITLQAAILDGYVGTYKLGETAVFTITRDGAQLNSQLTGQPSLPIYPESTTEFFSKLVNAQISFVPDAQGKAGSLILHQNGQNITMPRIDAVAAQKIANETEERIKRQKPAPGSEAALRRMIESILAGNPNYDEMSPELAKATRQQLPAIQPSIVRLGKIQSIKFRSVGNMGWDLYDVKQEHGSTQWRIALGQNGIITGALVAAGP